MAKHIVNNMNELEKALLPYMTKMVDTMAERVYETLNDFLKEYYSSYNPISYRRQYDFLRSAVKIEPKLVADRVEAYVYIDYDNMNHYKGVSGYQVVDWANQGLHGGLDVGDNTPHVWEDTIKETIENGELLKEAIKYLKSKGFSVRV